LGKPAAAWSCGSAQLTQCFRRLALSTPPAPHENPGLVPCPVCDYAFAASRRRFLQGAGIALSLPFLESMLPGVARAAAKADGPLAPGAKPRRMFAICNNLGLLGDQFFPTGCRP